MSLLDHIRRHGPGSIAPVAAPVSVTPPADLNAMLMALKRYGRPHLHLTDKGTWWARIEMHVEEAGASFEIKSEYSANETPVAAVQQLTERIEAALAKWR